MWNFAASKMLSAFVLSLLFVGFSGCPGGSGKLQILHVNDLHSNFEHGSTQDLGGYAALKYQIDQLTEEGKSKGYDTLVLNGGDSFEGHPFYFINEGEHSLKLLSAMKFDASVMGNHDYLMGPQALDKFFSQMPKSMHFLGANFLYDPRHYPNIAKKLKPYVALKKGGLKIAVIGLTTNEIFFKWAAEDIDIIGPKLKAQELVANLRFNNDLVIVLSHLGTKADFSLVEHTTGIDMVFGAHDHTPLEKYAFKKNLLGQKVPVFQGYPFGEKVGRFMISFSKDKTYTLDRYEHVPVYSYGKKDSKIEKLIEKAKQALAKQFGKEWLEEVVAELPYSMESAEHTTNSWAKVIPQAFKEATQADAALDIGAFHGMTQPAGSITRYNILKFYPRMFEFTKKTGWTIWAIHLPGLLLKKALEFATRLNYPMEFAGISFEKTSDSISNIKINSKSLDSDTTYTLAIPEGVARGILGAPAHLDDSLEDLGIHVSFKFNGQHLTDLMTGLANQHIEDTGIPIWTALEAKLKALSSL